MRTHSLRRSKLAALPSGALVAAIAGMLALPTSASAQADAGAPDKAKLEKVQAEVGQRTVEGSAGGGMVVVTANGKNQIVGVKIDKQVVSPDDVEMLQDMVLSATNQAIERAQEMMNAEVSKVTGGAGVPGMF